MTGSNQPRASLWVTLARSRGLQMSIVVVVLAGAVLVALSDGDAVSLGRVGALGVTLLVGAQAVMAVSPLPSQVVAVPLAALHGFWVGAGLLWCGWMLAAVLQYGLARKTADDVDLNFWLERAPRWIRRFPAEHPAFLILTRQLPIGPHIVNITAGALGVPIRRHLWCAAIGVSPQAILLSGVTAGILG